MSDFKVKKYVSKEVLKLAVGVPSHVKILSEVKTSDYKGKVQFEADGKTPRKAADVCDVIDLEGNPDTPFTMIVNAVFKSELDNNYPKASYVGKKFRVVKGAKPTGKAYNTFAIAELE